MKHTITYSVLILICLCTISCKKTHNNATDPNNIPGLPPATQIGANTFGCLVNGVPWVPAGSNGTPNLSIDYDPGFNNGIFTISAMRVISPSQTTSIGIGIRDSLNFFSSPKLLSLSSNSLFGVYYNDFVNCTYGYFDTAIIREGQILIAVLNRTSRIIAGTFEAMLIKPSCDTIRITNGRFDFKF